MTRFSDLSDPRRERFIEAQTRNIEMFRDLRDAALANLVRLLAIICPGATAATLAFMATSHPAATTLWARLGLAAFGLSVLCLIVAIYYFVQRRQSVLRVAVEGYNDVMKGEIVLGTYRKQVEDSETTGARELRVLFYLPSALLLIGFVLVAVAVLVTPVVNALAQLV